MGAKDTDQHTTLATQKTRNNKKSNGRGEEDQESGDKSARDDEIGKGQEEENIGKEIQHEEITGQTTRRRRGKPTQLSRAENSAPHC